MFDDVYFGKMLKLMKTKKFRGYMTWGEAHLSVGLPRCYSKSTSVLSYSNDIVAILPKGDYKTVYYLRRGNDSTKSTQS